MVSWGAVWEVASALLRGWVAALVLVRAAWGAYCMQPVPQNPVANVAAACAVAGDVSCEAVLPATAAGAVRLVLAAVFAQHAAASFVDAALFVDAAALLVLAVQPAGW